MKKFDLKAIMTRAWEIVREKAYSMSTALRLAWYEAKNQIKGYIIHMDDERRRLIETYWKPLTESIKAGNVDNIHEIHKQAIIGAALDLIPKNGVIVTDGKTVGLLKYAMRQAAA